MVAERLDWFLRVLMLMLNVCMVCFHRFHFLSVTEEAESYHSSLLSHVYPSWLVTWVSVRGGCYRVVSDDGSPLGLNRQCIRHAFMSLAHVFSSLWSIYLLHMHGVN